LKTQAPPSIEGPKMYPILSKYLSIFTLFRASLWWPPWRSG